MEEHEFYRLPIYPVLYKETLLLGIPMNMAALNITGTALGLIVLHNLLLVIIFIILHIFVFIIMKTSKKFDVKILDILVKKNLKKYISY